MINAPGLVINYPALFQSFQDYEEASVKRIVDKKLHLWVPQSVEAQALRMPFQIKNTSSS